VFLLLLWADFLVLSPAPLALGLLLDRPAADDGIAQALVGLRGSVRTERDARAEGREGFHQNIANKLPLPTPDSGTPAADVPVAPPPGATGR
jgi:hypothetical protein